MAGTAVLQKLLTQIPIGTEIVVLNQTDHFGAGYVYDISQPPCFLLDRAVSRLPKIGKQDFLQWVILNKNVIIEQISKWKDVFPKSYNNLITVLDNPNDSIVLPRSVYGLYLEACFQALIKEAEQRGIRITPVIAKVTKIQDNILAWQHGHSIKAQQKFDAIVSWQMDIGIDQNS